MRLINDILYQELKGRFWALTSILVLMLLIVGFDAIAPWPFKILIDNVLNVNPIPTDSPLSALLGTFRSRELLGFFVVLVYFMSTFSLAIVEYLRVSVAKGVIKKMTAEFSKKAFQNLQKLALGFFSKQQIGDYIYRLSYDVSALGELIEEGALPLVTSSLYLIVTTTIMFFISVKLTFISLAALPFLALGLYSFNAAIGKATKRSEFFNSAAFSFIEEALRHLKVIQAFSQQERTSRRFGEKIQTSLQSDVGLQRLNFLLGLLVGISIAVSYSVIIVYGIEAVFAGALTTGLLIVFIFYLDNLANPTLAVIYAASVLRESYVKMTRMEDFFTEKTRGRFEGKRKNLTDTTIVFDRVSLATEEGHAILQKVSFGIEAQKRTVIFGVSGSGKTTLLSLIMRFIEAPTSGRILLGGVNIQDYDIETLRSAIAFVPQEITLFNDTVLHNIAFGQPQSSPAHIREAAELAAADEFIQELPGGYEFKVGEGGTLLSGGQRQRIMLARAFLKREAEILLFDETLSALDVKTRSEVLQNIYLFSRQKTMVLVSNIFAVMIAADNVIVLDRGSVMYAGPESRLPKELALAKMMREGNEVEPILSEEG